MDAPKYQQASLDPSFLLLQQQSQQQDVDAITERTRGDTASILARYGAMNAFAGTGGPLPIAAAGGGAGALGKAA